MELFNAEDYEWGDDNIHTRAIQGLSKQEGGGLKVVSPERFQQQLVVYNGSYSFRTAVICFQQQEKH